VEITPNITLSRKLLGEIPFCQLTSISECEGKVKLILLRFPTTYFPEQGFCQVLYTRNKYRNRLDMNKIGKSPFKLTNLQPALKKLADRHHCKVRISWNELLFWELTTFILQMHLHSFCFVITRLPVYISIALNYLQNKILFSEKQDRGDFHFQAKCVQGGDFTKKVETTVLRK